MHHSGVRSQEGVPAPHLGERNSISDLQDAGPGEANEDVLLSLRDDSRLMIKDSKDGGALTGSAGSSITGPSSAQALPKSKGGQEEAWGLMEVDYFVPNWHVYAWNRHNWSIYIMNEQLQRAGEILYLPAPGKKIVIDDVQYLINEYEELMRLEGHAWAAERLYSTFGEAIQQARTNARNCCGPQSDASLRLSLTGFPSVTGHEMQNAVPIPGPVRPNPGAHEYYPAGQSSEFPSGSSSSLIPDPSPSEPPFLIDGLPPTMESINRLVDRLKAQRAIMTCPVPGCPDRDKEQRRPHALRDHLCSHFNIRGTNRT